MGGSLLPPVAVYHCEGCVSVIAVQLFLRNKLEKKYAKLVISIIVNSSMDRINIENSYTYPVFLCGAVFALHDAHAVAEAALCAIRLFILLPRSDFSLVARRHTHALLHGEVKHLVSSFRHRGRTDLVLVLELHVAQHGEVALF